MIPAGVLSEQTRPLDNGAPERTPEVPRQGLSGGLSGALFAGVFFNIRVKGRST